MYSKLEYEFIFVQLTDSLAVFRDHSYNMSAKRWVGSEKWQFLLVYSTIYEYIDGWVGGWMGLQKDKNMQIWYMDGPLV